MERLKSFSITCVDLLLFFYAALVLIVLLGGGFSFSFLESEITVHKLKNPSLTFGVLLILRKIISSRSPFADIPVIRFITEGLRRFKASFPFSPMVLAGGLATGYALVMSVVTVIKHLSYNSHSFDLGIFDQVLWNTTHGEILYSTLLGGRHFFGEHFSPILLVLAPLYWIYEHPATLLVFQTCALASGTIPVYWLAKKKLESSQLAILFAWLYVCYQPIRNVNLFDFHPIALVTPLLLFAFWYLDQRNYGAFGIFLLLALACKEEIATIVFIFGVYIALVQKKRLAGGLLSLAGIAVFFVEIWVIIPYYRQAPFAFVHRYGYLGGNIPEILQTLVFRPLYVLKHVFTSKKMAYTADVFGPAGFLSFLSPSHLLLTIPTFLQNILSESKPQYTIGYQYTAPLTPFVFISAIHGLRNLFRKPSLQKRFRFLIKQVRGVYVISLLLLFLSLAFFGHPPAYYLRKHQITEHTRLIDTVIQRIPVSASASTQETLVPHLSHRKHIYEFPLISLINEAEYILLDTTAGTAPLSKEIYLQKVEALLQGEEYGVMLVEDHLLLLKRGHPLDMNAHALVTLHER